MSKTLREEARDASTLSHSPYSKAKVGAAIETEDGRIYKGCNIENSSFGGTVCAERVAIWKAVSEGHKKIKKIHVFTEDGWHSLWNVPSSHDRIFRQEFGSGL